MQLSYERPLALRVRNRLKCNTCECKGVSRGMSSTGTFLDALGRILRDKPTDFGVFRRPYQVARYL